MAGLLLTLYAPLLIHWVDGWLNKSISTEHEYYSHGLIGLPFAAYLCWSNRDRWQELPNQSHITGLVGLIAGVLLYLSGVTNAVNLSFPIILIGLCLWLKGLPGLKLQAFPLLLVFLATPTDVPYLIAPYTLPLQEFIAGTAGFILLQFNMSVRVDQIYLYVNDQIVEVAPYCAGLKMLFTSLYVGLILVYWTGVWNSRSKTGSFFLSVIFISVSANIIRNTLLTFFHGTGRDQAFDWLHDGWGGDLYSACMLGLLVLLLRVIDQWLSSDSAELEVQQ
ncbi:cyanoexosortase B [Oscillatoria sp. FACHB-1407]|uniref:cyanoexosortase B n=1 Tax=Oscillatoria sp. FACHB-1407 TaxID=2692847 RepID=UPI001F55458A|nr:cyanoexosortase B [Oscillatoria sp. FACHB-1407]